MKRRSFILTSGSTILSGTAFSSLQRPAFGLEFDLATVPNRKPRNMNSILIDFSKFNMTPRYIDDSKDAIIKIDISIGNYSQTVSKSISVENGSSVMRSDLKPEVPIIVDHIDTDKSSIVGEIVITVTHESIGSKTYKKQFTINDNPVTNGLVSYYPIDKGDGEIIHGAADLDIGQITGANWNNSSQSGSKSLDFDGSSDEVILNSDPYVPSSDGDISTSAWFRYDVSDDTASTIYGHKHTGQNTSWRIVVDSSDRIAGVKKDSNGSFITVTGDTISTGTWHHVTIMWDGSTFSLYLDGSFQDSKSVTGHDLNNNAHSIGSSGGFRYFGGLVEDVRVYNRILSEEEIKIIIDRSSPEGRLITENDVPSQNDQGISRWSFNDSSNQGTATDSWSSNNGNVYGGNYVNGVFSSALEFPIGTNDYVDIEKKIFQNNNSYTISVWWNEYDNQGRGGVFQRDPNDGAGFHFGRGAPDRFTWYVRDKSNDSVTAEYNNLNNDIGNWTHFTGVFDAGEKSAELYRNGKSVGSDTNSNLDPSNLGESDHYNTRLARRESNSWNGRLDDVRIYNQPLTETQIQQLFSLGSYNID